MSSWPLRAVSEADRSRYRSEGWWTGETLGQRLADRLSASQSCEFVIHSDQRPWRGTFGEVLTMAQRMATGLAARGVGPGDTVSFQTPNWIEGATTFYAAAHLGAIVAPVTHIYGSRELRYILETCEPKVHVTALQFGHQDYVANLESLPLPNDLDVVAVGGDPPGGWLAYSELLDHPPIDGPVACDPEAPALIGWTSGTTAHPKGVIHSHQSVLAEVRQLGDAASTDYRPVVLANPISHAIGMLGALLIPVDRGTPVHLLDQFDPSVVLELMLDEDLGAGGGAPYFLTSLLDHPDFSDAHLARLTEFGMGGAPVPRVVTERATRLGIVVHRKYGSTEHPSITGCTAADPLDKRLGTDGRPLTGVEIRLVDEADRDVLPGEPGEVLSKGPELFLGYTDPDRSKAVFDEDGWYHTGDIAIADSDGYISISDRKSDLIIRGGENVGAGEIEELLLAMDGIAELAVVAAPDERMGEHAVAVLRMLPGQPVPTLEEIRAHLSALGLARQKWPEEVVVVDDFPRTTSGKIQKFVLRERISAT